MDCLDDSEKTITAMSQSKPETCNRKQRTVPSLSFLMNGFKSKMSCNRTKVVAHKADVNPNKLLATIKLCNQGQFYVNEK